MSEQDLERLLRESLDASARGRVPADAPVPPQRLHPVAGSAVVPRRRRRPLHVIAPLAAAAVVLAVVAIVLGLRPTNGTPQPAAGPGGFSSAPTTSPTTAATQPVRAAADAAPVHLALQLTNGAQVGIGMPVIAYLSRPISDARSFAAATTVTMNGHAVKGCWFFERATGVPGAKVEADFRMQHYWPAHAKVRVSIAAKGMSAGKGLGFDNDLSLRFTTGAAHIVTVSDTTHQMTVMDDGKMWRRFPVSLGSSATPTMRGTKVIMEKGLSICMSGPGYDECGIKDTQRLSYSGEYLHAAPWNVYNIEHGVDSSNGCTNLLPKDAAQLYKFLRIGDVVRYPNADGPAMKMSSGYGDWNVPWTTWERGGLYPTS